jgi:DNA-binding NarL/FixJ family response regulator
MIPRGRADQRAPRRQPGVRRRRRGARRTNEGICRALFLSAKTVEGHIRQIFMKLGMPAERDRNRRELAVLAFLRANG